MRSQSELAHKISLFVLICAMITPPAFASSLTLDHNRWELLVIPANPHSNSPGASVRSLFSHLLPEAQYNVSWTTYTFDSVQGRYNVPAIDHSLLPGQAFWVLQTSGQPIELALSQSLTDSEDTAGPACAGSATCLSIPVNATTAPITWNMMGIPLSSPTDTRDILFVNGQAGQACSDGCTLSDAMTHGHFAESIWVYNSTSDAYENTVATGALIPPGKGFWAAALTSAAGSSPALHIPTTNTTATDCSWFVSPQGQDSNNGSTPATAFRTTSTAIAQLIAGDTLCLLPGTYPAPLVISNKAGTAAAPITIKSYFGKPEQVIIEDGPNSLENGIVVTRSTHLHIKGLQVQRVLRGIQYNTVTHGSISGNIVRDIQQEGIRVGALWNSQGLADGPSSQVVITGNHVENTGLRLGQNPAGFEYNEFGEGIYVGTGGFPGDATHDILVDNNVVVDTSAEGIEVKPYTRDIMVSNNTVSGSRLKYAGAISIAIGPLTVEDGNYLITDNKVFDIGSRQYTIAGIVVGQGNAVIANNTVWDIEGGRGIRVYTTFVLASANAVHIQDNTVWNPQASNPSLALHDNDGGFGLNSLATVTTSGNITDDGSAQSTMVSVAEFVGPVTGRADNGAGPGSGLRLHAQ